MKRHSNLPTHLKFRPTIEGLEDRSVPTTLLGLNNTNQLLRFDTDTPGTIRSTVNIQGLNAGEAVVGIDYRPRTGQLYAVAVDGNGTGLNARLLTVNPFDGATTAVGTGFTLPANQAAFGFGLDFNPTVDALRVVNTAGANIRVDPNTGALISTDVSLIPPNQQIDAAAYDRNFDGRLGALGTTLYVINRASGQLQTQGGVNQTPSPNTGLLTNVGPLGIGFDLTSPVNFDIVANGAAGGIGLATFDTLIGAGVNTQLATVNLATGLATLLGTIGIGTPLHGLTAVPESHLVAGGFDGTNSNVEVRNAETGDLLRTITPFPGFRGNVRVAAADVNRDSVPDVIVGAGTGGGSHVKVFDGGTGAEIRSFFAYGAGFTGGVFVAGGDVNGDGFADIITGAGETGGSHVKVFDGQTGAEIRSFFAYGPGFTGGVRVAAADFDRDGLDEIVTAAGFTGAPHVKVFSPLGIETRSFFAYATNFTGGVYVAAGDVDGDGIADIIIGAGAGGGPHVRVFEGESLGVMSEFFAFPDTYLGGARVGVADVTGDGRLEVLAAPGAGRDAVIRAFDGPTGNEYDPLSVLDGEFGVFVGGVRV